jgi:4-hydroxy-tetrahydrodipicolinate synthase
MARFGTVLTAMVTPFDADGGLDLGVAADVARWLVEQGNDGLVVSGTTGESPVLTDQERIELWRAVREAVDVPIVVGSTSNDTAHSVALTAAAEDTGVDGVLAVTPYYSRPPQAGIEAHFRAVAAATPLPVMLYDVPVRTARKIATDTILTLADDVANIVALKDAGGDPAETARLLAKAPDGFEVYSGDEPLTPSFLSAGAVGVVGVAAHWTANEQAELFEAWDKGDVARVQEIHARLLPSYDYMNNDTCVFAQAAKAALRVLGLPVGDCRLPLGPAPADAEERARTVLRGLGRKV